MKLSELLSLSKTSGTLFEINLLRKGRVEGFTCHVFKCLMFKCNLFKCHVFKYYVLKRNVAGVLHSDSKTLLHMSKDFNPTQNWHN